MEIAVCASACYSFPRTVSLGPRCIQQAQWNITAAAIVHHIETETRPVVCGSVHRNRVSGGHRTGVVPLIATAGLLAGQVVRRVGRQCQWTSQLRIRELSGRTTRQRDGYRTTGDISTVTDAHQFHEMGTGISGDEDPSQGGYSQRRLTDSELHSYQAAVIFAQG